MLNFLTRRSSPRPNCPDHYLSEPFCASSPPSSPQSPSPSAHVSNPARVAALLVDPALPLPLAAPPSAAPRALPLPTLSLNALLVELRDMFLLLHACRRALARQCTPSPHCLQLAGSSLSPLPPPPSPSSSSPSSSSPASSATDGVSAPAPSMSECVNTFYNWFEAFFEIVTCIFDVEEDVLFAYLEKLSSNSASSPSAAASSSSSSQHAQSPHHHHHHHQGASDGGGASGASAGAKNTDPASSLPPTLKARRRCTKKGRVKETCWDILELKPLFDRTLVAVAAAVATNPDLLYAPTPSPAAYFASQSPSSGSLQSSSSVVSGISSTSSSTPTSTTTTTPLLAPGPSSSSALHQLTPLPSASCPPPGIATDATSVSTSASLSQTNPPPSPSSSSSLAFGPTLSIFSHLHALVDDLCDYAHLLAARIVAYQLSVNDVVPPLLAATCGADERRLIHDAYIGNLRASDAGRFAIVAFARGMVVREARTAFLENALRVSKNGGKSAVKQLRKFQKHHTDLVAKCAPLVPRASAVPTTPVANQKHNQTESGSPSSTVSSATVPSLSSLPSSPPKTSV